MKRIVIVLVILLILASGCATTKIEKKINKYTNKVASPKIMVSNEKVKEKELLFNRVFETKGYYDYEGLVENVSVRLTIYYFGDKKLVGTCYYKNERKQVMLKGEHRADKIMLNEYNELGNIIGSFEGNITEETFNGKHFDNQTKLKNAFKLQIVSIMNDTEYGERYAIAGIDEKEGEQFADKLQKSIIKGDINQVGNMVNFPIEVSIDGRDRNIKNIGQFKKLYNKIFYPEFKNIMIYAYPKNMFANWRGIMFGEGLNNVWINKVSKNSGPWELKITQIIN